MAFQQLLKYASAALPIEKRHESATVSEKLIYQVISFNRKYNNVKKLMKN